MGMLNSGDIIPLEPAGLQAAIFQFQPAVRQSIQKLKIVGGHDNGCARRVELSEDIQNPFRV